MSGCSDHPCPNVFAITLSVEKSLKGQFNFEVLKEVNGTDDPKSRRLSLRSAELPLQNAIAQGCAAVALGFSRFLDLLTHKTTVSRSPILASPSINGASNIYRASPEKTEGIKRSATVMIGDRRRMKIRDNGRNIITENEVSVLY